MGRLIRCHIWFSNYSKEHITCIHWRNQRSLSWLICQVDSKSEELLTNHKFSIIVKEFISVKGPQLYYQCPNCKGKLSPIQENVKAVSCSCCSTTKKARLSQQMYSCIVEFNHDSDRGRRIILQKTKYRPFWWKQKIFKESQTQREYRWISSI